MPQERPKKWQKKTKKKKKKKKRQEDKKKKVNKYIKQTVFEKSKAPKTVTPKTTTSNSLESSTQPMGLTWQEMDNPRNGEKHRNGTA